MSRQLTRQPGSTGRFGRFVFHAFVLFALWMVLARGETSSLVIGLPLVAAAAALSVLAPPASGRLRPVAALRFTIVFLGRCFVAGVDVARRAFGPRDAIRPGLVDYRFTVSAGAPRALLANAVSLLPGTMSTAIAGDVLRLHVLDTRLDVVQEIASLERLVAEVFSTGSDDRAGAAGGSP